MERGPSMPKGKIVEVLYEPLPGAAQAILALNRCCTKK